MPSHIWIVLCAVSGSLDARRSDIASVSMAIESELEENESTQLNSDANYGLHIAMHMSGEGRYHRDNRTASGRCIKNRQRFLDYAEQFTLESIALRILSRANGYLEHYDFDGELRYGVPGEEIHDHERKGFVHFDTGPSEEEVLQARHTLIESLMTNFATSKEDAEVLVSVGAIRDKAKGYVVAQEKIQQFVRLLIETKSDQFRYCVIELESNAATIIAGVNVMLFPSNDPEIKLPDSNFGLVYTVGVAERPVYQLFPYPDWGLFEKLEHTVSSLASMYEISCLINPVTTDALRERWSKLGWYMMQKKCEGKERVIGDKALELGIYHSDLFSSRRLIPISRQSAVKPLRPSIIESAFAALASRLEHDPDS